jgi:thymidylate synthase ThyX
MGKFTKRFSDDQERAILSVYFTNPHGQISFIKPNNDFGPEELAALGAKFSRSDKPYQAKFLEQLEKDQSLNMNLIDEIASNPAALQKLSLGGNTLRKDTARFHQRWSLGFTPEEKDTAIRSFGDDSVKDGAPALYHAEGILDNDNKLITSNPINNPQVVSTRYIDRSAVLSQIEKNPDIFRSKYAEEIIDINSKLGLAYVEFTDLLAKYLENNELNQEFKSKSWLSDAAIDFELGKWQQTQLKKDPEHTFSKEELNVQKEKIRIKKEADFSGYARKTVFDFTRYFLTPAIPTSMFVSSNARSFEQDITTLLSSPMETARILGHELLAEGSKVMPTLLGEKSRASKSEFIINMRQELTDFVKTNVEAEKNKTFRQTPRTNFLDGIPSYNDAQLASSIVFPYSNCSFGQLYSHFRENPKDITHVVDTTLRLRGKFDADPEGLMHGGLMMENLVDYGAYRDIQRHRRGHKSRQLLTAHHGIDEVPKIFAMAGVEEKYLKLMDEVTEVYQKIEGDNPYVAQLAVPFAFKMRTLYSWQAGQHLFFSKLRSGEGGIISYRKVAWDVADHLKEITPEMGRLLRVNRVTYPEDLINLKEAKNWYNENKR